MTFFEPLQLMTLSDALDIAEDATGNHFKFSLGQWKNHRYDVKTLSSLDSYEVNSAALAVLNKGKAVTGGFASKSKNLDFYLICLQDPLILKVLERDRGLSLLSLLVYVFTHELVHIVRFCNFFQRFDAHENEKIREEKVVHRTTFEILRKLSLPGLDYVLDSYENHRVCSLAF